MGQGCKESEEILRESGIVFLSGEIDEAAAARICQEIIGFNLQEHLSQIHLVINSPGGFCPAGFAIIDIMEWSKLPVRTSGVGMIGSMALLVFMAGDRGRRVVTSNTSILSHRFSCISSGNHSQLLAGRKEQDLEHHRIVNHYLVHSNVKSIEELEQHLLRDVDTWLSADEAIRFGLADLVEPAKLIDWDLIGLHIPPKENVVMESA